MKKIISSILYFIILLFVSSFQTGDLLCDSKYLNEKAKNVINPYNYDSAELTHIVYKNSETIKEVEVPLFIGEKYRFAFILDALPKNVEVKIYNKGKESKNRKLLFTSKDGGQDKKEIQWEISKVRQVFIDYVIPPVETGSYSGCAVFMLGYK
jgi:hypothetical protein